MFFTKHSINYMYVVQDISAQKLFYSHAQFPRSMLVACVADRRAREGKGGIGLGGEEEGTACKDANWSDLINYLIRHPDWSATCHSSHSRALVFSHSFIQYGGWRE